MNGDRIMFEVVDYQKSGLGNAEGYESEQHQVEQKMYFLRFSYLFKEDMSTLACNWSEGEINPLTAMAASISYSTIMTAETGDLGADF